MNTELTGKASIDRPWLKFYQGVVEHLNVPECTLREYLTKSCDDVNIPAVHYYGTDISWAEITAEFKTKTLLTEEKLETAKQVVDDVYAKVV